MAYVERIQVDHNLLRARTANDLLNARNFTRQTLCMVNSWAKLDFQYYGYKKIVPAGKNYLLRQDDGNGYDVYWCD